MWTTAMQTRLLMSFCVATLALANAAATDAVLLKALNSPGASVDLAAVQLQPMQGAVFFIAGSSGSAIGLWKTETGGTNATLLKDLGPKKLVLRGPFELGGKLLWVVSGPGIGAGDPRRYELWSSDGSAAGTSLLKVLGQEFGTDAGLIAKAGSLLYFNAAGLWRTDGTAAGTVRLTGGGGARLSPLGDRLLFTTFDPTQGELLWMTDGTVSGTGLVADIGLSNANNRFSPDGFVEVEGIAYFVADDGVEGMQLWRTDGTAAGTRRVKRLPTRAPKSLVAFKDSLFFLRDRELWRSDGTDNGTVLVSNLSSEVPGAQVGPVQAVADHLWFGVVAGGRSELWRSDGTPSGTMAVATLADWSHDAVSHDFTLPAQDFIAFRGEVYFRAYQEVLGIELWRTDGTASGTRIAADLNPGTLDLQPLPLSSNPGWFVVMNEELFLIADMPGTAIALGTHPKGVWRVGPPTLPEPLPNLQGVRMVKDINPIGHGVLHEQSTDTRRTAGAWAESRIHAFGNRVFFFGRDQDHGLELWSSDGTEEGTRMVKDIYPGPGSINLQSAPHTAFLEHQNQLYFCVISTFPIGSANIIGVWRTDGSESGTVRVWSGKVDEWTQYGGFLFVSGDQGRSRGLWRIAGIPEEAVPVHLRSVDDPGYSPELMIGFAGRLFFVANSDSFGRELWTTDSTFTNVFLVKNFQPDGPRPVQTSSFVEAIHPAGETCFVVARSPGSGLELWKTDGTEPGTVLVKDINPGISDGFEPGWMQLASLGGRLYFSAVSEKSVALWASDGTEPGTRVVHAGTGRIRALKAVGDRLYFAGGDSTVGGEELWISDGTESGTFMLANINPDRPPVFAWGSSPEGFELAGGSVYFKAGDNRFGAELWKTDGSSEGTVRVTDLNPIEAPAFPPPYTTSYRGSSYPRGLTVAGTNLFFIADDGTHGRELWVLPITGVPPPRLEALSMASDGFRIRILANPGAAFQLLRTPDWSGPWTEVISGRVPDSGTVEVRDDRSPPTAAFYRITTSGP